MQLSEIKEHMREFSLDINEGELAVLMVAAKAAAGSFPEGSTAEQNCLKFVRECEGWNISPKNHGL